MKSLTMSCAMLLALAGIATAQSTEPSPGVELSDLIFGSMENTPTGTVDLGEFVNFGRDIFASMDTDQSGAIDLEEFTIWDFGFNFIAEDEGQERAYQTAQRVLFAYWDHGGDGEIDEREYHHSMVWDFRRADVDNDAFLTREEFQSGYIVNLAYRAAIGGQ